MKKTFYLTTPLYYPNARPHVGSAYTTIVCDVIARYKRMCGEDVAFLTGTDEHGEKLERAAAAAGKSPSEFVAEKRELFKALWKKLGINFDYFVYTDQPDHIISVQRMLLLAQKNEPGVIEKRRYEGRYCVSDERYISDGAEPANCDICGRPAELITEENYFFKLAAYQDRLLAYYEAHPEFVQPSYRLNEVVSFVKSGLRDISVSRKRIKWGIPWPDDPEQVFYVWYDALTGYLTGIGYADGENGSDPFQKYWRNDPQGEVVHMIGKDILRFHAVYWPAFLMAARLPLPKTVFAHGWIYYEEDKMSKSKGNVVYPEPIVDALDMFGAPGNDALRYYLLREATFGLDMSFSYDALIQGYNANLANGLGNLATRTLTMINRYFPNGWPKEPGSDDYLERIAIADGGLLDIANRHFGSYEFSTALRQIWDLISEANKYLVREQPWALAEENFEVHKMKIARVLYNAAEVLRCSAVALYPVMPSSAQRLWRQLGCESYLGSIEAQRIDQRRWGVLSIDRPVGKPEPIFPRLDKAVTLTKLEELAVADRERDKPKEKAKPVESEITKPPDAVQTPNPESRTPESSPPPEPAKITIDDFAKVEMRVGEVLSAEAIPGATKLLKVMVDIGTEVRQVCAGIAEHYQPEQLVGMKVVLVTNLQPRKMRGVESNGMILAALVSEGGKPVLATFKEDVPKGARLK